MSTLTAGLLIDLGGFVVGLFNGFIIGRGRRKPLAPVDERPICGCMHHYSFHDPETKQCHGTVGRTIYDADGKEIGTQPTQCTCRLYSGPTPISTYTAGS